MEVPLLFESKMNTLFDYTLGVSCSYLTQFNNLVKRGSKSPQLDLSLNSSSKFDKYASRCSFLINNDSTIEELKKQVDEVYLKVLKNKS